MVVSGLLLLLAAERLRLTDTTSRYRLQKLEAELKERNKIHQSEFTQPRGKHIGRYYYGIHFEVWCSYAKNELNDGKVN
ncbi:hypothetical protein EV361DRAFT_924900 [Lentinula raphanica]|nr:hypothetical protein EV361DRAFT_924900 [Lentinula raphanica]